MAGLNFHHLRYFHAIAETGGLTRAARRLNVSPSALSVQLKELEGQFGQELFERRGRRLVLTEAGRVALDYAATVFQAGDELVRVMRGFGPAARKSVRIGAVATLSRNFQLGFLKPLIAKPNVELIVHSGSFEDMLEELATDHFDLVLSNTPAPSDGDMAWENHLIDQQPVSLVSRPPGKGERFRFPDSLKDTPVLLPSRPSGLRVAFDALMDKKGIRPIILAQVDDMAMLRLLARESEGVTLVPPVVVRDELRTGMLKERCRVPGLSENFYAIARRRRFPNPLVRALLPGNGGGEHRP
jgi:LysR family transcriptional activator of nhaA